MAPRCAVAGCAEPARGVYCPAHAAVDRRAVVPNDTRYLGDGAYVTFNGSDFMVWADRSEGRHYIVLDVVGVQKLAEFVASVQQAKGGT